VATGISYKTITTTDTLVKSSNGSRTYYQERMGNNLHADCREILPEYQSGFSVDITPTMIKEYGYILGFWNHCFNVIWVLLMVGLSVWIVGDSVVNGSGIRKLVLDGFVLRYRF